MPSKAVEGDGRQHSTINHWVRECCTTVTPLKAAALHLAGYAYRSHQHGLLCAMTLPAPVGGDPAPTMLTQHVLVCIFWAYIAGSPPPPATLEVGGGGAHWTQAVAVCIIGRRSISLAAVLALVSYVHGVDLCFGGGVLGKGGVDGGAVHTQGGAHTGWCTHKAAYGHRKSHIISGGCGGWPPRRAKQAVCRAK